jgi:glycosyltransferase involved in cell wall biosynthesis
MLILANGGESLYKIGIFTTQLPELTTGGGIGNVTCRLAKELAQVGLDVEILFSRTEVTPTKEQIAEYLAFGVKLRELTDLNVRTTPWWLSFQNSINTELEDCNYDLIISQEWKAPLAIAANLSKSSVPIVTWIHGGTLYDHLGSDKEFEHQFQVIDSYLEQVQLEKSDVVVSPSHYLVDFYKTYGWNFPETRISPYHFPRYNFQNIHQEPTNITLAFVSALSKRKGFDDALSLVARLKNEGLQFTFGIYGKFLDITESDIVAFLQKNKIPHYFRQELTPFEIWRELSEKNTTVLLPSKLDNSPSVAYEALSASCKILTSNTQGTLELQPDFPNHIFKWSHDNLEKVRSFIESDPILLPSMGAMNEQVTKFWEKLIHETLEKKKSEINVASGNETNFQISVVIITKDRPDFFRRALDSVLNQSLLPGEIIVVEDVSNGSTSVYQDCIDANKILSVKYQQVSYSQVDQFSFSKDIGLGQSRAAKSRNLAASIAKYPFLAFLDDDNLFLDKHLELSLNELHENELDAVTPFLAQVFSDAPLAIQMQPTQIAVMAGSRFGPLNSLANVCMDSHILIKKEIFDGINGFPENSRPEDWAMGLRLIANGYKFGTTGVSTVLYRLNLDGIQAQLSAKSTSWVSLDKEILELDQLQGGSWLISKLAAAGYQNRSTSAETEKKFRKYYFSHGLRLLKSGNFKELWFGIRKYLRRLKFFG